MDIMPHSVHIFLEMVSHKLWDNTVFWHHYGTTHIVSAAPIALATGEARHHHFQHFRLGGVSYAEYSDDFPHAKYTVGFAGHGPGFFINTFDNSKTHAPGAQEHHDLDDEADPCFAKVISGFDVVDALHKRTLLDTSQVEAQVWSDHTLTKIVKAEIIPDSLHERSLVHLAMHGH